MKTLAAVLVEIGAPLKLMELELPPLKRGQVLVEVAYSGLCHSQLNEMRGLKGEDRFLPHTLGHEGTGVVLEVGPGVTKVQRDDRVVLSWIKGSGEEAGGTLYSHREKKINSGPLSTFLSHAVVSENRVVPLNRQMPLREAALFGCALPTGAGVVRHEMHLQPHHSFALFGAGGVGLSALLAARSCRAYPLIVVDVHEGKLLRAKELGATHVIHATLQDSVAEIRALTGGVGVDFAFESAGRRGAMESAFASVRAPGGLCVIAGNLPVGERIEIDPFELIRGKRIMGTWGGKSAIEQDVPFYTELFLKGEIPLGQLITHEVNLSQIQDLVEAMERGEVGRGLIRCQ